MCGIVGIARLGSGGPVDSELICRMRDTMRHRGPDGAGIWVSADRRVGLGHRRLSILDLSEAASQPMADAAFDVVYSFGVLHHTDHMEKAVAEIRRVLRPGGRAIIGVYHRDSVFFWLNTVAWRGIVKGGFLRVGWARTLARIEAGAGDDYVPTVQVLTRSGLRRLFGQFRVASIRSAGVMPDDFLRLQVIARRIRRATLERTLGWLGWYLVVVADKEAGR